MSVEIFSKEYRELINVEPRLPTKKIADCVSLYVVDCESASDRGIYREFCRQEEFIGGKNDGNGCNGLRF